MKKTPSRRRNPLFEVRHSPIHGYGVFAARRIRKGTTIIEYLGNRVSHAEADERYEDKSPDDNHTFLFTVDAKTVIDAGIDGNEARFINHACDPNCESTIENKRVFIRAVRTIQPGEELAYDYQIERDSDDAPNVDEVYACRCGAKECRGTMLTPAKKPRKPVHRSPRRVAGKQSAARKRTSRRGAAAGRSQRRGR
jgi:SET domain-containing protein